ncbi:FmdE family protein [Desulfolucanica intricata]|uniref:FmdE family protein n=1 Tax=Desulfolucanica intricata TaxID=1285191 RepID=UPI0008310E90|nr:FmdE family protein [Desulfolucanica intricata]
MRVRCFFTVLVALLFVLSGIVWAQDTVQDVENFIGKNKVTAQHLLGARAAAVAMDELSFDRGDENVLSMTSAGYAIVKGQTTEKCVDGITAVTGCTTGGGNLLVIHRSKELPLWFAFYKKDTKEMIYLQANDTVIGKSPAEINTLPVESVFSIIAKENIDINSLLGEPEKWNEKISKKVFGGNESSLIGIANIWSHTNTTYDYLQAAKFHNHICPGVTSGYLIIKYLDKYLPLKPGQSYKIIACPAWCKDDALQVILDTTVGKKAMYVMELTEAQKSMLPDEAKGVAGLFIRWDGKSETGDGLVLGFDFDKAGELAGTTNLSGPFVKLKTALTMMDYVNHPETMVSTLKQFKVTSAGELTALQSAGVNPLVKVGLMNDTGAAAAAAPGITVKIDGKVQNFSQPLVIINDRTMVSLRAVAEALGFKVDWDGTSRTVFISTK